MSPSRRGESGGNRSAEQRERDRRERERRRARREGGGRSETDGPYDILASEFDPTVSRPPDLDWPMDIPAVASGLGPTSSRQPEVNWPLELPPRGDPEAPQPAGHAADNGYDPHTGHDADLAHEAPVAHEGYTPEGPHHTYDPQPAEHAYDAHEAYEAEEPAIAYPAQVIEEPSQAYSTHPGDWHHPGYGPQVREPGSGGERGRAASARNGRRGLAGRLPSISLPAGRPSLPSGLGGLGERLSSLRGSHAAPDPGNVDSAETTEHEVAPPLARAPVKRGPSARGPARRVRPAADGSAASRVGSLRRSLDPRSPIRSQMSDRRQTDRRAGLPRGPRGRIGAIAALVVVLVALWFLVSLFQPLKGGGSGTVDVVIPAGAGTSTIGTLLAKDHVISSAFFFKLRAEISGKRGKLESGRYVLRQGMSYGAALAALTGTSAQPAVTVKVTIPEGDSRVEIAAIAKKAGVIGDYYAASVHSHVLKPTTYGAPKSVHSLEGFLFPDTYDVLPGAKASTLINDQLVAFKQNLAKVDLTAAKRLHLTAYDVVTIASMVEREAEVPRERPLIAAVIYNRLRDGMSLGIDATLRYALNDFDHPLTDSQLASNSPYNTRIHKGLPPTPIGNPGLASLEAAAHPAKVSYLYYVVKPGTCGEDAFSSTFAQFEQDSARYNNARNADNGRSPTTCSG